MHMHVGCEHTFETEHNHPNQGSGLRPFWCTIYFTCLTGMTFWYFACPLYPAGRLIHCYLVLTPLLPAKLAQKVPLFSSRWYHPFLQTHKVQLPSLVANLEAELP